MGFLKRWWLRSILARVAVVLLTVTALALTVILAAAVFTEQSMGKGSAINVSGSLRMQSNALALAVAKPGAASAARAKAIRAEADEFERRLLSGGLVDTLPTGAHEPLALVYRSIKNRFETEVRPLALEAIDSPAAQQEFLAKIGDFVLQVDGFVRQLEVVLETRMGWLRIALAAAFGAIVLLGAVVLLLLNAEVFRPLKDLSRAAQAVRAGGFQVRAKDTGPDEIGQLGQAFNYMIEDLARLYGSLEKQVAEKTADLDRRNQSLGLLYETTRLLSGNELAAETLKTVLAHVEGALGAEGGVICARRSGAERGFPLAVSDRGLPQSCRHPHCEFCSDGAVRWHSEADEGGERRIVCIPLVDSGTQYGVMPLVIAPGRGLEPWQLDLAETVGRHIGAALGAAARHEEGHKLAVLEERSIIARELHDSIAQSLAYTKIQLVRLAALLQNDADRERATVVLGELREGVSTAYRQLREVLTTFRLKVGRQGLQGMLSDAVTEFQTRTGLGAALDNRLTGFELSANEQVHVLQIVREALSNVEKHAHAKNVWVRLDRIDGGAVGIEVEDDGVGIPVDPDKRHHFGLSIMRDRAESLGGELVIEPRTKGGTRVRLAFHANSALARAASAPV
ncbi:MAG: histidine kinase [Burkholderiaceae bacterium]